MVMKASLPHLTAQLEGFVGPTHWELHYDAERWITRGRFDLAVVIAQTAFDVTRKRTLEVKPRGLVDRRLKRHPKWSRYQQLRDETRNVFVHEGKRPAASDATEFVSCVCDLMKLMDETVEG